jgi:ribosomal protein S27AE
MSKKPVKEYPQRPCDVCGTMFIAFHHHRKYCGQKTCQAIVRDRTRVEVWSEKAVSKNTLGAVNELRASADLLLRGFEVFRSVSPSCSCDLIAMRKGITLRVEVRTGYRHPNGNTYVCKHGVHDVIAACFKNEIVYSPHLPADAVFGDTP